MSSEFSSCYQDGNEQTTGYRAGALNEWDFQIVLMLKKLDLMLLASTVK